MLRAGKQSSLCEVFGLSCRACSVFVLSFGIHARKANVRLVMACKVGSNGRKRQSPMNLAHIAYRTDLDKAV
jgi:hypothetical protein